MRNSVAVMRPRNSINATVYALKPLYGINTKKLYSLTNIIRAVQSKLRNSKNHFEVDTRNVTVLALRANDVKRLLPASYMAESAATM